MTSTPLLLRRSHEAMISARDRLEEVVRESKAWHRMPLEHGTDAITLTGPGGLERSYQHHSRPVRANYNLSSEISYSSDEIIYDGIDLDDTYQLMLLYQGRCGMESDELSDRISALYRRIEESLGQVCIQAADKGLSHSYTIRYGTPGALVGDPGRLRQVLVNLLSNAVKFTEEGSVSVCVSSKSQGPEGHRILFEVVDTGIGIPEQSLDKLFKPFSQVKTIMSRGHDGAGLGLAICKGLVEMMGGEILAESSLARRSKFIFNMTSHPMRSYMCRQDFQPQLAE